MPELIDRAETLQKLCAACYNQGSFACISCVIPHIIKDIPASDAEPVRHGRWIPYGRDTAYTKYYRCSLCGYEIAGYAESDDLIKYNYCPNCGADMREGGADNGNKV